MRMCIYIYVYINIVILINVFSLHMQLVSWEFCPTLKMIYAIHIYIYTKDEFKISTCFVA